MKNSDLIDVLNGVLDRDEIGFTEEKLSLDKIKYYDAFKKYDKEKDSSMMTNLILDYEILELEKYIGLLEE